MYSEARKLELIKNLLNVKDEITLQTIELLLKQALTPRQNADFSQFVGVIPEPDITQMREAIEQANDKSL